MTGQGSAHAAEWVRKVESFEGLEKFIYADK